MNVTAEDVKEYLIEKGIRPSHHRIEILKYLLLTFISLRATSSPFYKHYIKSLMYSLLGTIKFS